MKNASLALRSTSPQPSARKEVIESCLPLVKSVAARMRLAYGLRAAFEDLYSAGVTGLLEASERFDPSRGVAFTTFAYYRIRGAILDAQRAEGRRVAAPEPAAFVQLSATLMAQQPANTNAFPLADPDDTGPGWAFGSTAPVQLVPFEVLDSLEDESAPHPDEEVERRRRSERLREALGTLPDLERRVLELYYYEDESFAGISAQLGMCKPWAFRLHARALHMLREALGPDVDGDGDVAEEET
jgi:RNA polymerase sigma factor for flagellar operon FliA